MKISCIITNYNQGRFVKKAVQSVLNQDRVPDEIVIVDDCSTDNSVALIEEFIQEKPVKLIQRATNGRPAGCRNTGIQNTTGDIICFLDIDDYYYSNKISSSVPFFEDPSVGLVYSDYDTVTPEGKMIREFKSPYSFGLLWNTCIVSTNSIVSRKALEAVGLFNPKWYGIEDYDMWLRIGKEFNVIHIPKPLFAYNQHGQNLTTHHADYMNSQTPQMKKDLWDVWNKRK